MKLRVDGDGPVVVKLGGIAGGVELFREVMDVAVRGGFRVAALDNTGDRHDDPADSPLDWDSFTAEIESVIDTLKTDRAILWGTSFGCVIALAAAARLPEKVSGILLSFPPDPEYRPRAFLGPYRWLIRKRDRDLLFRVLFILLFGGLTGWEFIVPTALSRAEYVLRTALEARTPTGTVMSKLRLMWETPVMDEGSRLDIPTRIIAGKWDLIAPVWRARRIASVIPGAVIETLAHAGHAGQYSRPLTYGKMAVNALKELSGASLLT